MHNSEPGILETFIIYEFLTIFCEKGSLRTLAGSHLFATQLPEQKKRFFPFLAVLAPWWHNGLRIRGQGHSHSDLKRFYTFLLEQKNFKVIQAALGSL